MRDRSVAKKTALQIVAVVLAIIFFLCAGLLGVHLWEQWQNSKLPSSSAYGDTVLKHNGKEYVLKDNVETLLVMGLDKFDGDVKESSYNNDRQADFIMLLVIDNDKPHKADCSGSHLWQRQKGKWSQRGRFRFKVVARRKRESLRFDYYGRRSRYERPCGRC